MTAMTPLHPECRGDSFMAANRTALVAMTGQPSGTSGQEIPANTVRRYVLAILAHVALIAAWYIFVAYGHVPSFVMPSPVATIATLGGKNYSWIDNTLVTASEIFGGYFLAVFVGVIIAIVFSWSRTAEDAVMPLLVSLNMIPKVALGPLFIVWFSYGIFPNTIIAFSISFFPILLNTARGFREVEPELLELVRSLRSSKWQTFIKIQLPSALPYIFSGMKVGAILAVAGAIVGEFLGSSRGLGYLMLQVQVTLDTAAMFMAVILITVIGVMLYGMVVGLERLVIVRDARVQ
jgi:NitT/TauT family transport system permease protein